MDHNKKTRCKLIGRTALAVCELWPQNETSKIALAEIQFAPQSLHLRKTVYKILGSREKKYKLQLICQDKRIQVRINTIVLPEREKQHRLPDAVDIQCLPRLATDNLHYITCMMHYHLPPQTYYYWKARVMHVDCQIANKFLWKLDKIFQFCYEQLLNFQHKKF